MNAATPRLSFVIAARNVGRELELLLESLCASDFKDFEVCICDDASSDGTAAAAVAFSGRLNIKLVSAPQRLGVTGARNRALALAAAPLLLFADADVKYAPDTVSRLLARLEGEGCDIVEGAYAPEALDPGPCSDFYALFSHHSFLLAGAVPRYNVFNAWCALCRREAILAVGGHQEFAPGIEIDTETLGRRLAARGYRIFLDPEIAVAHHWGGARKLIYIYTARVYWWVKTYFSAGRSFEAAQTTASYAAGTAALPAAALLALLPGWPAAAPLAAGALFFLRAYAPFLVFVLRRRGPAFSLWCAALCALLSFPAAAAAAWSGAGELLRLALGRGYTVPPETYR